MPTLLDRPMPYRSGLLLQSYRSISLQRPLIRADIPAQLIIPLRQHKGSPAEPIVQIGDEVYKGQCIAQQQGKLSAPVHASSSGTIIDIGLYPGPNPRATPERCIVIKTDQCDRWPANKKTNIDLQWNEVYQYVLNAGVVGMGGDGLPSAIKLNPKRGRSIDLLILNASECEPYTSCDTAAIQHHPQSILAGLELVRDITQAKVCVIGVCDDMPAVITALQRTVHHSANTDITISPVVARYPVGEERQLIKSLTGVTVPATQSPADVGILIYNVGTVLAIYNAVFKQEPLIHRLLTVTGPGVNRPGNIEVLIGTPIKEVIKQCGGYNEEFDHLILDGPLHGFRLYDDCIPVTKTSRCLLAADKTFFAATSSAMPCIRCSECVQSCPVNLLPHELLRHAQDEDSSALAEGKLSNCIECGCCAYVCPSQIPLVDYFRKAKQAISIEQGRRYDAILAKVRFEKKQQRKKQDSSNCKQAPLNEDNKRLTIAAAVKRVRARRRKKQLS